LLEKEAYNTNIVSWVYFYLMHLYINEILVQEVALTIIPLGSFFLGEKDNIHATISLSRTTILTCICLTKNWNHQLRHNKPNTLTGEYLLVYFRMNRYSIFCLLFRVVLAWIRCQQEWPPDSTWRQAAFHKWIYKSLATKSIHENKEWKLITE
jgi:hypothetical protein